MNLSKEDLNEIRNIVREEVKKEIKEEVGSLRKEMNARFDEQDVILNTAFTEIQNKLNDIQEQINEMNSRISKLESEVKSLRTDLDLTKSAVSPIVNNSRQKENLKAEVIKMKKQLANLEKAIAAA